MRKRLGELLVERGLIDDEQLRQALSLQRRNGMRLGVALVGCGHIDEDALVEALGELLQVPTMQLDQLTPDEDAVEMVSARFAAEHDVFPVRLRRDRGRRTLTVAMSDPLDMSCLDELGFMTNARIEPVLASASDVDRAIRQVYGPRLAGVLPTHPLKLRKEADSGRMTILRRGGGEEEIDTGPLTETQEPPTADLPVVTPQPSNLGDGSPQRPILLTEEVSRRRPAPVPRRRPNIREVQAPAAGDPTARAAARRSGTGDVPTPSGDLGGLGALVGASGQAVDADTVSRLERRVWAILRILSRKGFITKEEFMRELGDDQSWT